MITLIMFLYNKFFHEEVTELGYYILSSVADTVITQLLLLVFILKILK